MKHLRFAATAAGFALAAGVAACENSSITDINRNPNAPEEVSTGLLFANGVSRSQELMRSATFDLYFTSLWAQHIAEWQYPSDDQYLLRGTRINNWWDGFYAGPLMDLELAQRQARAEDNPNQLGPAVVMKTWMFSNITNTWGDVPYTEALLGDSGIITPVYDPQEEIYDSLFVELEYANDLLSQDEGATYGAQDPVYAGDPEQWRKFANSLRARLALILWRVDPTKAASELQAAVSHGGFESNADNATLRWPGNGVADNPTYVNQLTRDDHRVAETLVSALDSLDDPRLPIYADPVPGTTDEYAGLKNAEFDETNAFNKGTQTSPLGARLVAKDAPSNLMTYAEYAFIVAEGKERGWLTTEIAGTAASWYLEGVRASLEQWGVESAAITTYMASPAIAYLGGEEGIRQIATQKWISMYGMGIEAWTEYRRIGYPHLEIGAEASEDIVPRRIGYPSNETSRNGTNRSAAIALLCDGNSQTSLMWWDVLPLPDVPAGDQPCGT